MFDFIQEYFWFWTLGMIALLVVLVVVFVMVRKKEED